MAEAAQDTSPRAPHAPRKVRREELPPEVLDPKTEEDRRKRERYLFWARAAKMTWANIAEVFGIHEKSARDGVRRYRSRQRSDILDREVAIDIVHEALEGYEYRLEVLATMIVNLATVNEPVRLGAIRESNHVERERLDLLQQLRLLPRDLGTFSIELDLMEVMRQVVRVLDEEGVSEEVQHRILGVVRGLPAATPEPIEGEAEEVEGEAGEEEVQT